MTRLPTPRIAWILSAGAVLAAALAFTTPASAANSRGGTPAVSLTATPQSLDFGSQEVCYPDGSAASCGASAPQTVTITNTGSAAVEVYALLTTGAGGSGYEQGTQFLEYTGTLPPSDGCSDIVLAPGASCSESYTFAPFNVGPQPADVNVDIGGAQLGAVIPMTGRGTSPGAFVGSITVPSEVAQNGVVGGQSVTATLNLSSSPGGSKCVSFKEPIEVALVTRGTANAASAPSQVVVPAGQCSTTFTVTTNPTTSEEAVSILGTVTSDPNGISDYRGVGLTVLP